VHACNVFISPLLLGLFTSSFLSSRTEISDLDTEERTGKFFEEGKRFSLELKRERFVS
jgi:hypothetical protein